jgi:uncharacterized membrane protein YsdA (DUF1294 family)/cold shock CspA family protein
MEREETGTLITWDDEKGYGFIHPHNEKEDIFLHVRSLPVFQRRPKIGDIITYDIAVDEQERYYACAAKIKGMAWSRFTIIWFCLALVLGIYIYLVVQQTLSFHPVAIYAAMSLLTIWVYHRDKRAAQLGLWRTPERTLHLFEALGGWPGSFLAQLFYRHKLRKLSYQIVFWIIVAGHGFLWYHILTHQEIYQSYQQVLTEHVHTVTRTVKEKIDHVLNRNGTEDRTEQTGTNDQIAPSQRGSRSLITPAQHAHILEGIVQEIRPQEGVIVSLQSGTGGEGILDKSTLVRDFSTRFTKGEHIQVVIHTITIEGKKKRIELLLVEQE